LEEINKIANQFLFNGSITSIELYGSGHIHQTFKVSCQKDNNSKNYILQKVNTNVFKEPSNITHNHLLINKHLKEKDYPFQLLTIVPTIKNESLYIKHNEYWRAFDFIENSKSIDLSDDANSTYLAAKGFSTFLKSIHDIPSEFLKPAIPDFFNYPKRIADFLKSVELDVVSRKKSISKEINTIYTYLNDYQSFLKAKLPFYPIHGDPKINNILFNSNLTEINSVIDYDTLMPCHYSIEFGDMLRTMTCSKDENESDLKLVHFDLAKFEALSSGFMENLSDIMSKEEKSLINLASKWVILIQAVRFITDFLSNDIYYKIHYPSHNLNRCSNQLSLLNDIEKKIK